MKTFFAAIAALALLGGGAGFWYLASSQGSTVQFKTAVVERGNLLATVAATGTLEPEEVIDVGARVAGQIKSFGTDPNDPKKPIDYCSEVEEGTVLAQLDDILYVSLQGQAKANVLKAEADLIVLRSKLNQSERDWNRVRRLGTNKGVISDFEYDAALNAYESAKASILVGEAALLQAKELLKQADTNLSYTTIRAPKKGVVLDRRVAVGQTVVASLNAPSLFLIATDLTRMQIWASVNEADIGSIRSGQPVRFTVDAYPNEVFHGEVAQIRYNATMAMNVVTYTVVVNTDNSHRKLFPYQTANLQFQVDERQNALMVPASALRWRPQLPVVAPEFREKYAATLKRKSGSSADPRTAAAEKDKHARQFVWVQHDGDHVRPIEVRTGLTDGNLVEIVSGEVKEGDVLVTGAIAPLTQDASVNPLTPQLNSGKSKAK
ncbi:MAG: efflux RND transporter periplasmic adaptor subunit [Planctomycetia bacterium]|nr:efflux RND transporter periplasmic adaptor subunit [Planctomycetia bacterium]